MARSDRNKSKKGQVTARNFGISHIPQDNILNLKEITEKEDQVKKANRGFFNFLKTKEPKQRINATSSLYNNFQDTPKRLPKSNNKEIKKYQTKSADLVSWRLPLGWPKTISVFSLICLLLISPIYVFFFFGKVNDVKGKVLGVSYEAYDYLQQAQTQTQNLNIDQAQADFSKASDSFKSAQTELSSINSILLNLGQLIPVQGSKVKTGRALLLAGQALSEAGGQIAEAIAPLVQEKLSVLVDGQEQQVNLVESLIVGTEQLRPALLKLKLANQYLLDVDIEAIPADYQEQINLVLTSLPELSESFEQVMSLLDIFLNMLGRDQARRYLVVFQNNHELRPTGGFLGSFALIDIEKGLVKEVEVPGGGPYEINTFLKETVVAPEPLHLVNPHWYIQDSNWFPDWPESAQKIIWFYENSGGPSVDGVLALTPTVIEQLLLVTGPIAMPDYDVTVNAANFVSLTQNLVEVEYDKETNKPKQFIGDLLPVILEKVFAGEALEENAFDVLKTLHQALAQKFILLYFQDQELQEQIVDLGWAGEIKQVNGDYLMVNNANIGGGKTDGVIDEIIEHQSDIQADGSIIDTVTIKRIHRGKIGDPWTGLDNVNYVRVYVPAGSQLIEADGFSRIDNWRFQNADPDFEQDADLRRIEQNSYVEDRTKTRISQEFNKTVFGNWLVVSPGQSTKATFRYKLPFKITDQTDRYSLFIQKQPGSFGSYLISEVTFPDTYSAIWAYPDNRLELSPTSAQFEHDLATDQFFGLVVKK